MDRIERNVGMLDFETGIGIQERLHVLTHLRLVILQGNYTVVQVVDVDEALVHKVRSGNRERGGIEDEDKERLTDDEVD
jgi:hypothetical protein